VKCRSHHFDETKLCETELGGVESLTFGVQDSWHLVFRTCSGLLTKPAGSEPAPAAPPPPKPLFSEEGGIQSVVRTLT